MNTNFEQLEQEYNYWKRTIKNLELKPQKRDEEWWRLNFAKGFVSAIDKANLFN